ncbi:4-alpha-glucanotransferase [Novosphingobium chloroacetimidivorans]|uniref:4-alpha-glucanotransferase n=1 Tax=Novosphingobium chloroacetimidivorans TaxID=1428314 RepID=A0A7W7K7I8_9SPHN|nr:4-alpha-glucanotransferase [Novosphingobium chloroacetimidivorans]MBB4857687.1 4-alpha-glucanotransferase [Novosphingobium chloroacetimidivorans]
MSKLHILAAAVGIARTWQDADGRDQVVSDEALAAVLAALGYPCETDDLATASLAALNEEQSRPPAFLSVDVDVPLALPASLASAEAANLTLEHGEQRALPIVRGVLPPIAEAGYHRLQVGAHTVVLAIAPPRCLLPEDLPGAKSGRLWGTAIQIPSLHERAAPFGTFADLRQAVRFLAKHGAAAAAISPVHAPLPGGKSFYPYSPSSRLFLNPALAELDGAATASSLPASDLIDWAQALPQQEATLRAAFAGLTTEQRGAVEDWAREQGSALRRQATFDALVQHLGASDWRKWSADYAHPEAPGVARFAAEHADAIAFHFFAQWLADRSLAAVQHEAKSDGMAIGLVADLAVGIDPAGSDAWALQGTMLSGLTIGAPPDPLGPDGQNWALTGFSPRGLQQSAFAPWIATLRAALRHAGGVRIDHAFGLARLWVVPEGRPASEGAYLSYPFADMLRVVAIESHRAGAVVIGEDLGTRPPGFAEPIADKAILGMRVLWFERDEHGFAPAEDYATRAITMTGTHDTPTVAGWWMGRDIAWNRRLARGDWHSEETQRMADRSALWSTIGNGAPQPPADAPAPVVEAAIAHMGRTPSVLTIVPLEDLLGLEEQPNLPGTIDEHPNWRRRLSGPLADLLAEPATARRLAALIEARRA